MKVRPFRIAGLLSIAVLLIVAACNSPHPLPALPADATILAFGDSLTAGTGASEAESYPAVLAAISGRKVINAGLPGELSAGGVQRLPEILDREKPGMLILCHGGNDLLARQEHRMIAENLRMMIRTARERGVAVVLLAVPTPDLALKPPSFYQEVATEFSLPVEKKVLPHVLGKSSLKSDHIHPNGAGYRLVAEAVTALLKKNGALK